MKKYYSISLCLAVFALIACNKQINEVPVPATECAPVFTAYTTVTKTALSGLNVVWSTGDEISVFNAADGVDGYGNARYKATSISGGNATFNFSPSEMSDWTSTGAVSEYVAIYPYHSVGSTSYNPSSKVITFNLPDTQSYVEGTFSNGAFPMVAVSATESLGFSGICGVLRLNLKGSATISSIVINADKIAGEGTVDLNDAQPVLDMGASATDVVTYSCGGGVALDAGTAKSFDIVLPVRSYSNIEIVINDTEGRHETLTATTLKIKKNTITPSTLVYTPAPVDLSAAGYANCYVVNAAGNYTFKCIIPDGSDTAAAGTSAKWVWATSGYWASQGEASADKMVKNVAYDSVNNKISFTVPEDFTYGNVLIALLDAGNKISYGWHIWLTSPISDITVNGVQFMDRNLGAGGVLDVNGADANEINNTLGVMYQWGRKDAHPGPRGYSWTSETTAFTAGTTAYSVINTGITNVDNWKMGSYTRDEGVTKTIQAGQNPCTLITSATATQESIFPAYGLKEWQAETNPCPHGYSVPTREQFAKLYDVSVTVSGVTNSTDNKIAGVKYDSTLIIPVCGYRNSAKLNNGANDGRYWVKDHESTNAAHGFWYQLKVDGTKTPNTANEIHSAFVRCVKN